MRPEQITGLWAWIQGKITGARLTMGAGADMGGATIQNVGNPSNAGDAVNLATAQNMVARGNVRGELVGAIKNVSGTPNFYRDTDADGDADQTTTPVAGLYLCLEAVTLDSVAYPANAIIRRTAGSTWYMDPTAGAQDTFDPTASYANPGGTLAQAAYQFLAPSYAGHSIPNADSEGWRAGEKIEWNASYDSSGDDNVGRWVRVQNENVPDATGSVKGKASFGNGLKNTTPGVAEVDYGDGLTLSGRQLILNYLVGSLKIVGGALGVKLKASGGIKESSGDNGLELDFGTGTNQVPRGDHTHAGVYSPAGHVHTESEITRTADSTYGGINASNVGTALAKVKGGQQIVHLNHTTGATTVGNTQAIKLCEFPLGGGAAGPFEQAMSITLFIDTNPSGNGAGVLQFEIFPGYRNDLAKWRIRMEHHEQVSFVADWAPRVYRTGNTCSLILIRSGSLGAETTILSGYCLTNKKEFAWAPSVVNQSDAIIASANEWKGHYTREDDRYFTETEADARFAALAHTHSAASTTFSPTGTIAATDVQGAIAEVSGDVTALNTRVTTAEADITGIEADIADIEAAFSPIGSQLADNEARLDTLEPAVAALQAVADRLLTTTIASAVTTGNWDSADLSPAIVDNDNVRVVWNGLVLMRSQWTVSGAKVRIPRSGLPCDIEVGDVIDIYWRA